MSHRDPLADEAAALAAKHPHLDDVAQEADEIPQPSHPGLPQGSPIEQGVKVMCPDCERATKVEALEYHMGAALVLGFKCGDCGRNFPVARLSARGVALRKRMLKVRERRYERAARAATTRAKGPLNVGAEDEKDALQETRLLGQYQRELTRLDPNTRLDVVTEA